MEEALLKKRTSLGAVNPSLSADIAGPIIHAPRRVCGMRENVLRQGCQAGHSLGLLSGSVRYDRDDYRSRLPPRQQEEPDRRANLYSGVHGDRGSWSHTIRQHGAAWHMQASRLPMQWQLPCPAGPTGGGPALLHGAHPGVRGTEARAALISTISLWATAAWIFIKTLQRLLDFLEVAGGPLPVLGLIGFADN